MKFCKDCKYSRFTGQPNNLHNPELYICLHESSLSEPNLITGERKIKSCIDMRQLPDCSESAFLFEPKPTLQHIIDAKAPTLDELMNAKLHHFTCTNCHETLTLSFDWKGITHSCGRWLLQDHHWTHQCHGQMIYHHAVPKFKNEH